ncbi:hypothetical protein U6M95_12505, partial [Cutibacterium acnes]
VPSVALVRKLPMTQSPQRDPRSGGINHDDKYEAEDVDEDDKEEDWNEEDVDSVSDDSVCGGGGNDGVGNLDVPEHVFKKHAEAYCDDADYEGLFS